MEGVEHRTVKVNGINMHIAEKGQGPLILFIHGFPDLWYSWRHQITALASLGYRCVAPDLRGFGDTDVPATPTSYTTLHVVGDLIGLLDAVATDQEKVLVVGHDWGAMIAWSVCLYRPERVKALGNLSVAFSPRNPKRKPLDTLRAVYGNDYYICRFQPGDIESEFAQIGTERVLKEFLTYRNPGPLYLPKGKGFEHPTDSPIALPSWLSEEECNYYATKYDKTGFTGALNYYRNLDLNWELTAPWTGAQIKVPVKFIVGDLDLTYNAPGSKDYIHKGGFKRDVPFLEDVVVIEGAGHFLHQEKADEINKHIGDFFSKFQVRPRRLPAVYVGIVVVLCSIILRFLFFKEDVALHFSKWICVSTMIRDGQDPLFKIIFLYQNFLIIYIGNTRYENSLEKESIPSMCCCSKDN